jgi:GntR family transcriptional regulator / MocR family aminotransferase
MEPLFEFPLTLPPRRSRTLLRALHGQLRAAILDGRMQPGLRLPATRALAAAYGISRNTALAAYELLLSEGYLLTRRGAGAYVADVLPQASARPPPRTPADETRLNVHWRGLPATANGSERGMPRHDFRLGVPDQGTFPFEVWQRLSGRALRALSRAPIAYADPQGQPALREAIARHVSFARAVACRPEDVVVTAGAQQAFDLLARILVTPGKTVAAVENPGYVPTRGALAAAGARVVPVAVDEEGLVVEQLPADARVICVTPSHQFPLGCAMSVRRRAALLEFAQARGAVIIEDDYDGEFRFGGRPLDALQTLDRAESVFYVGTFSKSLFPAIRLGFVVAPPWARQALITAKHSADWYSPQVAQDTLAAFIAEGHMARHVRRMRQVYAARRQALLSGLERDFSRWLVPVPSAAGLHLAAFATPQADADALTELARQHEVGVYSLRRFYLGKADRPGLVFGYGATREPLIVEGLAVLHRLLKKQAAAAPATF